MAQKIRQSLSSMEFAVLVFIPFAAGHFISYVLRTVNAILGPHLAHDLSLDAGQIGLLTSAYFFAFAIAQLPVGIALDRYGPARVQMVLLMVAAAGSALFATADGLVAAVFARALMGVGLAACFMGSLKAVSDWLPASRMPSMNGYLLAVGGLGAITATLPAQLIIDAIGWRGMFVGITIAILVCSAVIGIAAPEPEVRVRREPPNFRSLLEVYADPAFRRTISVALVPHTVFFAVQGLWLASWLKDVAALDGPRTATLLLVGTGAMTVSTIAIGRFTERLVAAGYQALDFAAIGLWIFVAIQAALLLCDQSVMLIVALGFPVFGAFAGLEFAIVAQSVPAALTGRASTSLNLLIFTGSFLVQAGFGGVLALWPVGSDGAYPRTAYHAAFGLLLLLQLPGLLAWACGRVKRTIRSRRSAAVPQLENVR